MSVKSRSFVYLFWAVFALGILALVPKAHASVSVTAEVDSNRISVDDQLTYSIVIRGGGRQVQRPRPPELDAFTIFSAGTSSSVSVVNGRVRSTSKFTYVMVPHSTGQFTIPPIDVRVSEQLFTTDAIDVEVTDGRPQTTPQPPASGPSATQGVRQPRVGTRARPAPRDEGGGDVFVRAWVDKETAYVNEQVLLTYTVYTRVEASIKGFSEDPKLTGFWTEEFPPEKQLKRGRAVLRGQEYITADVRTVALFPTASGTYTLEPGTLQGQVRVRQRDRYYDDFFGDSFFSGWGRSLTRSESRVLPTRPITIEVKEFPEAGRLDDFAGAVGDFDITAEIDASEVEENEPVTLKVKIIGEGNIQGINEPRWPELADFKYFDSGSSSEVSTFEQRVIGEKTYEKLLIPQKAGTFKIHPVTFSYFDPEAEQYRMIKTQGFTLKVNPGPEEEAVSVTTQPAVRQAQVEFSDGDIHYIRQESDQLQSIDMPLYENRLFLGLQALPLVFFLGSLVWVRRRERLGSDQAYARLSRARKSSLRLLKSAHASMRQSDEKGFYAGVSQALRQYVGDKLNLPTAGLSVESVSSHLKGRGVTEELVKEFTDCLKTCDHARFAPGSRDPERMQEVYRKAGGLLNRLGRL